jgi:replicative DNA helicase/DNA-binding transcriptional ArsR family regulator
MTEQATQVPPHAFESEKALLGHLLDHPESFACVDGLEWSHFYEKTTRVVAKAIWQGATDGQAPDRVTVARTLREIGAWNADTQQALLVLDQEPAIPPSHVPQHAEVIRRKAKDRELLNACRSAASLLQSGADPKEAANKLRELLDEQETSAPVQAITPLSNVDLCEALMGAGPRIPLGIQTIDDKLHGGMRIRKVFGFGGAPGAWKTSLLVQIADHLCQQPGIAVAWLAYDECAEEILSRRLQARGVPRNLTEDPDEYTLAVAAELDQLPFKVFENRPLDEAVEAFARMYPEADRFVFIDSAQKMWTHESRQMQTLRERIDVTLETCRRLREARATQCAMFMTSEVGRGSYRSKNGVDQTDDLAAGKESGSIEYGMDVWSVLRVASGDPETITMSISKNRIGSKALGPDDLLEFLPDREHCRLRVLGADAREEIHRQAAADTLAKARAKILKALRDNPRGLSNDELREEARVRKGDFTKATRKLLEDNLVERIEEGRSHRTTWRIKA